MKIFYKLFSHILKILVVLNNENNKRSNMVVSDRKCYQKMKSKSWVSIEKNIIGKEKNTLL